MLKQRVITALILLAVIIGVLALGGTTAWGVLMLPVMALAIHEWTRLLGRQASPALPVSLAVAIAYGAWRSNAAPAPEWLVPVLGIGVLAWVFVAFRSVFRVRPSCSSPWLAAFSMLLLWVSLFELRNLGAGVLISAMAIVWLADIGAYFSGRAFGRRKLAPRVSPGKTWEGVAGGAVLCIGTALVVARAGAGAAEGSPDTRVDLDLSAFFVSEDFTRTEQIAYYNLRSTAAVRSRRRSDPWAAFCTTISSIAGFARMGRIPLSTVCRACSRSSMRPCTLWRRLT